MGLVAKAQNRTDVAAASFERVLSIDSRDVGSNVNLGQLLVQERKYPEAMERFRAALAVEPYNVTATYNLAMAYMRTGGTADGQALMKRFQSLKETGRGTALGGAYPEQGRYAEGITSTGAERELVDRATPAVTYRLTAPSASAGGVPGESLALIDADQDGDWDVVRTTRDSVSAARNDGGRLTAADFGLGAAAGAGKTPAVAGDYDNDGRTDLFLRGRLFHNEGQGRFKDVTGAAGLPEYPHVSRAAAWVDADRGLRRDRRRQRARGREPAVSQRRQRPLHRHHRGGEARWNAPPCRGCHPDRLRQPARRRSGHRQRGWRCGAAQEHARGLV
jgi:hypothetical protein